MHDVNPLYGCPSCRKLKPPVVVAQKQYCADCGIDRSEAFSVASIIVRLEGVRDALELKSVLVAACYSGNERPEALRHDFSRTLFGGFAGDGPAHLALAPVIASVSSNSDSQSRSRLATFLRRLQSRLGEGARCHGLESLRGRIDRAIAVAACRELADGGDADRMNAILVRACCVDDGRARVVEDAAVAGVFATLDVGKATARLSASPERALAALASTLESIARCGAAQMSGRFDQLSKAVTDVLTASRRDRVKREGQAKERYRRALVAHERECAADERAEERLPPRAVSGPLFFCTPEAPHLFRKAQRESFLKHLTDVAGPDRPRDLGRVSLCPNCRQTSEQWGYSRYAYCLQCGTRVVPYRPVPSPPSNPEFSFVSSVIGAHEKQLRRRHSTQEPARESLRAWLAKLAARFPAAMSLFRKR